MRRTYLILIGLILLCLTGCAIDRGAGGDHGDKGAKASTENANLKEYYKLSDDLFIIVVDGVVNDSRAIRSNGHIYLPYSIAKSLDTRFYYNRDESQMIITTPTGILYFWPNETSHTENGAAIKDETALLRTFDGVLYVEVGIFQKYSDVNTRVLTEPQRIVLYRNGVSLTTVQANKDTVIRLGASMQKDIVTKLKDGEQLVRTGSAQNGYLPVSTIDGMTGYVSQMDIGTETQTMLYASTKNYERYTPVEHVRLMWHQMWAAQGGTELRAALQNTKGINVISPTWFDFKDVNGAITSFANASYVEEAHSRGIQVWALCSDFAADVKGYDVLSKTESRNNLANNLVNEVVRVGADGINLDFEFITKDSGPHYIQFIRELYLLCRQHHLTLSVDNFVPNAGKAQYQLADQGDILDYVIFMAYDEHYKGSEAGSVASFPWVQMSMNNAAALIPNEKIVLGIPLYNRMWMTDAEGKVTLEDNGMSKIAETARANAQPVWNDELKQYYFEYTKGKDKKAVKYQLWLEDVTSLEYKLNLINDLKLAGYAGWKLGLESSDVWDLLNRY
ncbi:MAG: hypothetical protein J5643_04205 [Lachnospiraceae bacterium]|nr:hypothetical protein [Lachnospiraceae bacterium]